MNETLFSMAEARGDVRLGNIGRDMVQGNSGFVLIKDLSTQKPCWMAYTPLASNGWSLGVLFPKDELMADIQKLNWVVISLCLGGMLLMALAIIFIARSITRPLTALAIMTDEIAAGNLEVTLPELSSGDEVEKLTTSFNAMQRALKKYIQDLTQTTAANERIESELKIARDIQMGILPKIFPPFPHRAEFDLYATIVPAKEVGGDLYDFFFLDEDRLCFVVGDVSGKGIPAALFMAVSRTMIKAKATQSLSVHEILSRINEDLSMDNPSMMFVTLFMYTDGITEAINKQNELFSEKRFEEGLLKLAGEPIETMISGIMKRVETFSEGVPQADDITIMAIRYKVN